MSCLVVALPPKWPAALCYFSVLQPLKASYAQPCDTNTLPRVASCCRQTNMPHS